MDVVGSPGTPDDWLCEPAPDGGWACVRAPASAAAGPTGRRSVADPPSADASDVRGPAPAAALLADAHPAKPLEDVLVRRSDTAEPPAASGGRLIDAPATHYAVQLVALSSEQALREFVADQQLADMTPVRVERGGRLHYALLAGIYPNRAAAERAVAAMAPALRALGPWIRSIDNLRKAMARADRLAEMPP